MSGGVNGIVLSWGQILSSTKPAYCACPLLLVIGRILPLCNTLQGLCRNILSFCSVLDVEMRVIEYYLKRLLLDKCIYFFFFFWKSANHV